MTVSPPFNISETTPADNAVAALFPATERTYRDTVESWLSLLSDPTTGLLRSTGYGLNQTTGYLFGLTLSNNAGDAIHSLDIAAGAARDSTDVVTMALTSALTKVSDVAWAVGSGNGGLDTGGVSNTTYHIWLIRRPDTGVVDALFSLSATAPTMPANYTQKRRIGSIYRLGGGLITFKQDGDRFRLTAPVADIFVANPGIVAVTRTLASVPTGIVVWADIVARGNNLTSGQYHVLITALDEGDIGIAVNLCSFTVGTGAGAVMQAQASLLVKTNTSAQIRSKQGLSGASDTFGITTFGWIDQRGKLY